MDEMNEKEISTTEIPDDIEIVNLGADDVEAASARAAVEAMKNSGMFAEPDTVVPVTMPQTDEPVVAGTTPVFSAPQTDEIEQPSSAAEAVAMAKAQGEIKRVAPPPIPAMEGPASAAEAVAMLHQKDEPKPAMTASYTDTLADDFAIEEQYPEWKAELDKINREAGIKISDIETGLRDQVEDLMSVAHNMIQTALGTLEKQIAVCEQSMRDCVKKAGSSTEEAVMNERNRMQEIANVEKEAIIAEFEKQIQEIKAEHNQEILKIKDEKINALDKMNQLHTEQLEEIKKTYEEKISMLKA